jgi:hypothetical protein
VTVDDPGVDNRMVQDRTWIFPPGIVSPDLPFIDTDATDTPTANEGMEEVEDEDENKDEDEDDSPNPAQSPTEGDDGT